MSQDLVLYIILRNLKISQGKRCSQVVHAGNKSYCYSNFRLVNEWINTGSKTIIQESRSELEYNKLKSVLSKNNLKYFPIVDSGLTYVEPGTQTCFSVEILDRNKYYKDIFKDYKLLK